MRTYTTCAMTILVAVAVMRHFSGCCCGPPGGCGDYDDDYHDDEEWLIASGLTLYEGLAVPALRINMEIEGEYVDRVYSDENGEYGFWVDRFALESREDTGFTLHLFDRDGVVNGLYEDEYVDFEGSEIPVIYDFHLVSAEGDDDDSAGDDDDSAGDDDDSAGDDDDSAGDDDDSVGDDDDSAGDDDDSAEYW